MSITVGYHRISYSLRGILPSRQKNLSPSQSAGCCATQSPRFLLYRLPDADCVCRFHRQINSPPPERDPPKPSNAVDMRCTCIPPYAVTPRRPLHQRSLRDLRPSVAESDDRYGPPTGCTSNIPGAVLSPGSGYGTTNICVPPSASHTVTCRSPLPSVTTDPCSALWCRKWCNHSV